MQNTTSTVRLLMTQWQGGNNSSYPLGARLLEWLAPKSNAITLEVPVVPWHKPVVDPVDGVVEREALVQQVRAARNLLLAHKPDRVVVFGGDCLVEQGPISYLNEKYEGNLGVLWIDAHPDIATPKDFPHAHTMVLGNLLGEGDPTLSAEVPIKLKPQNVMFAGLQETTPSESQTISRLGLKRAWPHELAETSSPVLDWIKENKIQQLAIHLDLDVLDPTLFRALLFSNPIPDPEAFMDYPTGEMTFQQVSRLIRDVSSETEVVGLGIAEHMPWEAIYLQQMLSEFPILTEY